MFTAALESAAFVEKDLRKLITIALSKVPDDSRIARSVRLVCDCFDKGEDWITTRNKVTADSADLGWFQAPANVAFTVLGLLYGGGDFGRTLCLAVNCGDDTDCTAATAGAVMGILLGADAIPSEWKKPIGDKILTKSFNRFNLPLPVPSTVTELSDRVLSLQARIAEEFPRPRPVDLCSREAASAIWKKSSYALDFDISFATVRVEYTAGPLIEPGKKCGIRVGLKATVTSMPEFRFRWLLPEGWRSARPEFYLSGQIFCSCSAETDLTPPESLADVMSYITLEVTSDDRRFPVHILVPLRLRNAVVHPRFVMDPESAKIRKMILYAQKRS